MSPAEALEMTLKGKKTPRFVLLVIFNVRCTDSFPQSCCCVSLMWNSCFLLYMLMTCISVAVFVCFFVFVCFKEGWGQNRLLLHGKICFTAWSRPRYEEKTRFRLIRSCVDWNLKHQFDPRETQYPPQTWCLKIHNHSLFKSNENWFSCWLLRRGEWLWLHVCKVKFKDNQATLCSC